MFLFELYFQNKFNAKDTTRPGFHIRGYIQNQWIGAVVLGPAFLVRGGTEMTIITITHYIGSAPRPSSIQFYLYVYVYR